jgi:hypothetical protein
MHFVCKYLCKKYSLKCKTDRRRIIQSISSILQLFNKNSIGLNRDVQVATS